MNIGQIAKLSGLITKMIRHYGAIGLIGRISRNASGYRDYTNAHLEDFIFIKHARDLGFSLEKIKTLMQLWHDNKRQSRDVKMIATEHLMDIEMKINYLQQLRDNLKCLINDCSGNSQPDCPILNKMANK